MARPKRFHVIATGQAQANLPPIFTLATPGDEVVWIETPTAVQRKFSRTSRPVLAARGIRNAEPGITLDTDMPSPDSFRNILLRDVANHPASDTVFVLTGGQKHLVLGIDRAVLQSNFPIAYMDLQPATLFLLDRPDGEFTPMSLENPIQYYEWLAINELCFETGKALPIEVWPNPQHAGLDPARFRRFANDPEYQRTLFAIHQAKAAVTADKLPPLSIPDDTVRSFEFTTEWAALMDRVFARQLPGPLATSVRRTGDELFKQTRRFFARQFQLASVRGQPPLAVDIAVIDALKRDGWLPTDFDPHQPGAHLPGGLLGARFEEAVALRVAEFLDANPHLARPVVGVYLRTSLATESKPTQSFAEFDVAILLENATLILIECKCGRAMDARESYSYLGRLQQAGRAGASFHVCFPMFPELVSLPEFEYLHRPYQIFEDLTKVARNFSAIFYSKPGRDRTKCKYGGHEFEVASFEERLRNILGPYAPRTEWTAEVR